MCTQYALTAVGNSWFFHLEIRVVRDNVRARLSRWILDISTCSTNCFPQWRLLPQSVLPTKLMPFRCAYLNFKLPIYFERRSLVERVFKMLYLIIYSVRLPSNFEYKDNGNRTPWKSLRSASMNVKSYFSINESLISQKTLTLIVTNATD